MFTVRVDHGPLSRDVYECARYQIRFEDGRKKAMLSMDAGNSEPMVIHLADGGIAYIMNAQGTTVDVVRTQAERKS
jgi:hypothetical protein